MTLLGAGPNTVPHQGCTLEKVRDIRSPGRLVPWGRRQKKSKGLAEKVHGAFPASLRLGSEEKGSLRVFGKLL